MRNECPVQGGENQSAPGDFLREGAKVFRLRR
jgi:hypothetical protein